MLIFAEYLPSCLKLINVIADKTPLNRALSSILNKKNVWTAKGAILHGIREFESLLVRHLFNNQKYHLAPYLKHFNDTFKSLILIKKQQKNKEVLQLDFTINSLKVGQKSEFICRVFADHIRSAIARLFSLAKLFKSIYMSTYSKTNNLIHTTFTSCFNVKIFDRYSCKLILKVMRWQI